MKKQIKILISLVLCASLMLCLPAVSSAADSTAKLYNVYGDSMLLKQNAEAVFAGTGTPGASVNCVLENDVGAPMKTAQTVIDTNGKFRVSFMAPAGGYKEYTVRFSVDGTLFCTLKDVVFGELWLASGQSNMQYPLYQSDTYSQNTTGSEWLRFLYIESYPAYNGDSDSYPLEALDDIESGYCRWMKGTDSNLGNVSAVSFFFAQELQKKLDMPVGVLMPNLGGSMLVTWLSRETIESDPGFVDYIKSKGVYLSAEEWNSPDVSCYSTVTANYNKKIYPLRDFAIAGMIWYQGESEILTTWEVGYYERGLELMQSSYSELFGFDGSMPFIATQVAPFAYGKNQCNLHNNEFVDFQLKDPESRAVTTIYDLSLDYIPSAGSIHPGAKQPIGERMAECANGLVYGSSDCYTAATVERSYADGSDFYVTLRNTGDGLVAGSDTLYGFALCGKGGVYVQADAELVDDDTIKISSPEVESPVAASYAFAANNNRANVYSTINNSVFLPVAPFCTDIAGAKLYWNDHEWAGCDSDKGWLLSGDEAAGCVDLWSAENAQIELNPESPFNGEASINVINGAENRSFSVSPVYTYKLPEKKLKYYDNMLTDWSLYSTVSVAVRNNGEKDVELEKMRLYTDDVTWYSPEVNASGESGCVIPADGQWHILTFNLDNIFLFGNEVGAQYSRKKLDSVKSFELCFKGEKNQSNNIGIDDFRFTAADTEGSGIRFDTLFAELVKLAGYLKEVLDFLGSVNIPR